MARADSKVVVIGTAARYRRQWMSGAASPAASKVWSSRTAGACRPDDRVGIGTLTEREGTQMAKLNKRSRLLVVQWALFAQFTFVLVSNAIADAGCQTEPRAWTRPGFRPIDLARYERDTRACREEVSIPHFSPKEGPWITKFVGCMRRHGYIPLYDDGVFC